MDFRLNFSMARFSRLLVMALLLVWMTGPAQAQLQVTEIMANSIANPESSWEWIEVRNAGTTPLDLNGYYFSDDDNILESANILTSNTTDTGSVVQQSTIIPAGGIGVLYNGTALSFDSTRLSNAWPTLPGNATLIGVPSFPGLANSGDRIGLWANDTNYMSDQADLGPDGIFDTEDDGTSGEFSIYQVTNAAAGLDNYGSFNSNGVSRTWNGTGVYTDLEQWTTTYDSATEAPIAPAVTSVATVLSGDSVLNDVRDIGNPGALSNWAQSQTGLVITEIMSNAASVSGTDEFEWVELYNNTGAAIDFTATPYVFDDDDGTLLTAENVTTGGIPVGGVAILFDEDELTVAQMQTAWGATNNYIPISDWPALANGGDTIGVWGGVNQGYDDGAGNQNTGSALATVTYDDDGTNFPQDINGASIHLDEPAAMTAGYVEDWVLSNSTDGISFNASEVFTNALPDHPGGETASPGIFEATPPTGLNCDADADGDCEQDDIDAMYAAFGATTASNQQFDYNDDQQVNGADVDGWLADASSSENAYNTDNLTFTMGDANLDGSVNSVDLGRLLNNFNSTASPLYWMDGNLNGDGNVNSIDLGLLLNRFGFASSASTSAVPEPNSAILIGLALLGLSRWIRRQ